MFVLLYTTPVSKTLLAFAPLIVPATEIELNELEDVPVIAKVGELVAEVLNVNVRTARTPNSTEDLTRGTRLHQPHKI